MKKLISIVSLLLCATISVAQVIIPPTITNNQSISNAQTLYKVNGALKGVRALILPIMEDTVINGIDSVGMFIYVKSGDNKGIWYRDSVTEEDNDGNSYGYHVWQKLGIGRDTFGLADDLYAVDDLVVGYQVIHRLHNDGLVSGGIVTWTGFGLTFAISAAHYYINQVEYWSLADTITLDPADLTDGRIDAFVVDTTAGIDKLTGVPSTDPVTPQHEPAAQWVLATILLNAGDLIPSNVVVNQIYNENIEWLTTTTGTLTNSFVNTDNPYRDTKAIFVSAYNNNSKLYFTYSGTVSVGTDQTLSGFFYSNGKYLNKLRFQFFNTNSKASNSIQINQGYGINPNDSNRYQHFAIPLSAFVWNSTTFNRLIITNVGSDQSGAKGYYLDNIQLQSGINNIPSPTDYSNKVDSVTVITGSDYYWIKGQKYLIGARGGSSARFGKSGEDATAAENRHFDLGATREFMLERSGGEVSYFDISPIHHDSYLEYGTSGAFTEIVQQVGASPNLVTSSIEAQDVGGGGAHAVVQTTGEGDVNILSQRNLNFLSFGTGAKTGTPAYGLSVTAAGKVIEVANAIAYGADNGASLAAGVFKWGGNPLTANSSIGTSAFNFTMTSSNATHAFNVINTEANANSIMASAVGGAALYGAVTTGFGVRGLASGTAGIGGFFEAGTGTSAIGVQSKGTAGYSGYLYRTATSENDVLGVLKIGRRGSTTGLGANGIGGSIDFTAVTTTGSEQISNQIKSYWSDATHASRIAGLIFTGVNNAVTADLFTLSGSGAIRGNKYGVGSFTAGTPAYNIVVDASGNFMESATPFGSASVPINSLLLATGTNTINNANYGQEWQWNTLSSGAGLSLTSTSTAAASSTQKLFNVSLSGANANASETTYGIYSSNSHSGTTPINVGIYGEVSNGTSSSVGVLGLSGGAQVGVKGQSSSSFGVYGISTSSQGVRGETTGGTGMAAVATTGTGLTSQATTGLAGTFTVNPASTNTIVEIARFLRTSSATAANGLGGSADFYLENAAGSATLSNQFISKWTDATNGTSQLDITGQNSAVTGTWVSFNPTGLFTALDVEITDTTKGIILKSPDGTRWRVTVSNAGALVVTGL